MLRTSTAKASVRLEQGNWPTPLKKAAGQHQHHAQHSLRCAPRLSRPDRTEPAQGSRYTRTWGLVSWASRLPICLMTVASLGLASMPDRRELLQVGLEKARYPGPPLHTDGSPRPGAATAARRGAPHCLHDGIRAEASRWV